MIQSIKSSVERFRAYMEDQRYCNELYKLFLLTEESLAAYSVKVAYGKTVPIYCPNGKPPKRVVTMLRTKLYARNYDLGKWDQINKRFYATYITFEEK